MGEFGKIIVTVFALFLSITFATVVALTWNDVVRMYWRPDSQHKFSSKDKKKHATFAGVITISAILIMILFSLIVHKAFPNQDISKFIN